MASIPSTPPANKLGVTTTTTKKMHIMCCTVQKYSTIILPVVLYGCETWLLTLREKHRLRVCENRVLRRIFRPKKDELTGEWRKLHNEELCELYCSPNIVQVIKLKNKIGSRAYSAYEGEEGHTQGFGAET
jgi:hypothetical protein